MSKKAKKSKMDLYYMKNGQAKNKTIIEEKEREKRIKEKKQETLKDEFDLETETVLQMTNRNRIKKEEEKIKGLTEEIERLKNSFSYKQGRDLTFVPRKLKVKAAHKRKDEEPYKQ